MRIDPNAPRIPFSISRSLRLGIVLRLARWLRVDIDAHQHYFDMNRKQYDFLR